MALGLVAGLVGGVAKKLVGKAASWVGRQTVGGLARKAAGAGAAAAATAAVSRVARGGPMAPPVLTLQQQRPAQGRPASLPVRIGQAITPGGRTGREFTPYNDADTTKAGMPIAVFPEVRERLYAPPGYVIVTIPATGERVGMLKGVARQLGLWKPDPKPPVNGWDMRAIRRAAAAQKRVKKLAGQVGFKCASKKGGRC